MNIYFITGHTASGKTDMVFELFKKFSLNKQKAIVINSDAYQIYEDIKLISTQPDFEEFLENNKNFTHEEIKNSFFLYNFSSIEKRTSVFEMINFIKEKIKTFQKDENLKNIIITGGSPMYIRLLVDGIEKRNDIPENLIQDISKSYDLDAEKTYQELLSFDENLSKKISLNDKKRVVNYLVNFKSLNQNLNLKINEKENFEDFSKKLFKNKKITIHKYILYKERKTLYENAEKRFDNLIKKNVIEEVENYLKKIKKFEDCKNFTSYKTLGIIEIENFLEKKITFEEMSSKIKQKTRNYIKHQDTWFRNKFNDFIRIQELKDFL